MITPHKTITQPPPAAAAAPAPETVPMRVRHPGGFDGTPSGWVGHFNPNNPSVRVNVVSGKLEVITGDPGSDPNQVFLDLLASATEDAPDGRTPEQCVRFAKDILQEFGGLVTCFPRDKWSDHHGREGYYFWGVKWTKRFHCDMGRSKRFQDLRCFVSVLAAEYETRHGKHTLGGGIFSKPE
jgi:hypothetical protein